MLCQYTPCVCLWLCRVWQPYVRRICRRLKEKYPHVPVVYYANGGSSFLTSQLDMEVSGPYACLGCLGHGTYALLACH